MILIFFDKMSAKVRFSRKVVNFLLFPPITLLMVTDSVAANSAITVGSKSGLGMVGERKPGRMVTNSDDNFCFLRKT